MSLKIVFNNKTGRVCVKDATVDARFKATAEMALVTCPVLALSQPLIPTYASTNSSSLHSIITSTKYKLLVARLYDHTVEWDNVDWIHLAQDVHQ